MNVTVKTFASVRDAAGFAERVIRVPAVATVAQVLDAVIAEVPVLGDSRDSLLVAVNEEYRGPDYVVREYDVIAIFPMVSGG